MNTHFLLSLKITMSGQALSGLQKEEKSSLEHELCRQALSKLFWSHSWVCAQGTIWSSGNGTHVCLCKTSTQPAVQRLQSLASSLPAPFKLEKQMYIKLGQEKKQVTVSLSGKYCSPLTPNYFCAASNSTSTLEASSFLSLSIYK